MARRLAVCGWCCVAAAQQKRADATAAYQNMFGAGAVEFEAADGSTRHIPSDEAAQKMASQQESPPIDRDPQGRMFTFAEGNVERGGLEGSIGLAADVAIKAHARLVELGLIRGVLVGAANDDKRNETRRSKTRRIILTVATAKRKRRRYLVRLGSRSGVVVIRAAWLVDKAGRRSSKLALKPGSRNAMLLVAASQWLRRAPLALLLTCATTVATLVAGFGILRRTAEKDDDGRR
ncbi:hypothetical protein M885DRAFT_550111 [Pelagophyceae sp. CCMP2097]|nr:hypothetical protein M885DRAFT_550111 [Pelagophyceae sp. CCMP2097]